MNAFGPENWRIGIWASYQSSLFGDILLALITLQEVINHTLFASQILMGNIKWNHLNLLKKEKCTIYKKFSSIYKNFSYYENRFHFLSEKSCLFWTPHEINIWLYVNEKWDFTHAGAKFFFARSQMQLFWYNTLILRFSPF